MYQCALSTLKKVLKSQTQPSWNSYRFRNQMDCTPKYPQSTRSKCCEHLMKLNLTQVMYCSIQYYYIVIVCFPNTVQLYCQPCSIFFSLVTPSDSLVRRSISQQKSGVSVTIDDPVRTTRQPSPPRGKVSTIIHVTNLVGHIYSTTYKLVSCFRPITSSWGFSQIRFQWPQHFRFLRLKLH